MSVLNDEALKKMWNEKEFIKTRDNRDALKYSTSNQKVYYFERCDRNESRGAYVGGDCYVIIYEHSNKTGSIEKYFSSKLNLTRNDDNTISDPYLKTLLLFGCEHNTTKDVTWVVPRSHREIMEEIEQAKKEAAAKAEKEAAAKAEKEAAAKAENFKKARAAVPLEADKSKKTDLVEKLENDKDEKDAADAAAVEQAGKNAKEARKIADAASSRSLGVKSASVIAGVFIALLAIIATLVGIEHIGLDLSSIMTTYGPKYAERRSLQPPPPRQKAHINDFLEQKDTWMLKRGTNVTNDDYFIKSHYAAYLFNSTIVSIQTGFKMNALGGWCKVQSSHCNVMNATLTHANNKIMRSHKSSNVVAILKDLRDYKNDGSCYFPATERLAFNNTLAADSYQLGIARKCVKDAAGKTFETQKQTSLLKTLKDELAAIDELDKAIETAAGKLTAGLSGLINNNKLVRSLGDKLEGTYALKDLASQYETAIVPEDYWNAASKMIEEVEKVKNKVYTVEKPSLVLKMLDMLSGVENMKDHEKMALAEIFADVAHLNDRLHDILLGHITNFKNIKDSGQITLRSLPEGALPPTVLVELGNNTETALAAMLNTSESFSELKDTWFKPEMFDFKETEKGLIWKLGNVFVSLQNTMTATTGSTSRMIFQSAWENLKKNTETEFLSAIQSIAGKAVAAGGNVFLSAVQQLGDAMADNAKTVTVFDKQELINVIAEIVLHAVQDPNSDLRLSALFIEEEHGSVTNYPFSTTTAGTKPFAWKGLFHSGGLTADGEKVTMSIALRVCASIGIHATLMTRLVRDVAQFHESADKLDAQIKLAYKLTRGESAPVRRVRRS